MRHEVSPKCSFKFITPSWSRCTSLSSFYVEFCEACTSEECLLTAVATGTPGSPHWTNLVLKILQLHSYDITFNLPGSAERYTTHIETLCFQAPYGPSKTCFLHLSTHSVTSQIKRQVWVSAWHSDHTYGHWNSRKSVRGDTWLFIINGSTKRILKQSPSATFQNASGQTNQHKGLNPASTCMLHSTTQEQPFRQFRAVPRNNRQTGFFSG